MGYLVDGIWHGNPGAFRALDRRPGRYKAYVPHPLAGWQPSLPADAAASVAAAEADLRETASDLAGLGAGMFFWAESLGSSRIEGVMPATRKVVHALARRHRTADREFHGAVGEVLANIDATEKALAVLADPAQASVDTLRDAHRDLMGGTATPHLGGVVRDEQNWVGGNNWHPLDGDFVPPPPREVGRLLDDLTAYLRSADHSPLIQAAVAHAQFETIHPFGDGNGRIGRAVLYAALKHRLCGNGAATLPPISLALSRDRDGYLDALGAYQSYIGTADGAGRSEALWPCVEAIAVASMRACAAVRLYVEAVSELQEQWREAANVGRRRRSVVSDAIKCLPAYPTLTADMLSQVTGYSAGRSAAALRHMEAARIVKSRTVEPAMRVYDADQVFECFAVMESTICDGRTSISDYEKVLAEPLTVEKPEIVRIDSPERDWAVCQRRVKSTGRPCGLRAGHRGHCRHLQERKHPPR